MYFQEKSEFNEIRERSFLQWLEEMEAHEDIAVRGGVRLAREYMQFLQNEVQNLKDENRLKEEYLKKLAKNQRQEK